MKLNVTRSEDSARQFIVAWQSADKIQDVANALGVTASAAANAAGRLRKAGVPLKRLKHKDAPTLDFASLAELAKTNG